jgi:hypothetical protein
LFDNIDNLYGSKSGGTQTAAAGATPPPPPGGGDMGMPTPPGPEPGGDAGITPESIEKRDNLKILLENDNMYADDEYIDLSKAKNNLGEIEDRLNKLLGD